MLRIRMIAAAILAAGTLAVVAAPAGAAGAIKPVLQCVFADTKAGTYIAVWGYTNTTGAAATIAVGGDNRFDPTPQDRGPADEVRRRNADQRLHDHVGRHEPELEGQRHHRDREPQLQGVREPARAAGQRQPPGIPAHRGRGRCGDAGERGIGLGDPPPPPLRLIDAGPRGAEPHGPSDPNAACPRHPPVRGHQRVRGLMGRPPRNPIRSSPLPVASGEIYDARPPPPPPPARYGAQPMTDLASPPAPSGGRTTPRRSRKWWYVGGVCVLVLALVGFGIWYFVFRDDSPAAVSIDRATESLDTQGIGQLAAVVVSGRDLEGRPVDRVVRRLHEQLRGLPGPGGARRHRREDRRGAHARRVGVDHHRRHDDPEGRLHGRPQHAPERREPARRNDPQSGDRDRPSSRPRRSSSPNRSTLDKIPAEGAKTSVDATGTLTLHGVTKDVTIPLQAERTGDTIAVTGQLDIPFADYDIQKPHELQGALDRRPRDPGGPALLHEEHLTPVSLRIRPSSRRRAWPSRPVARPRRGSRRSTPGRTGPRTSRSGRRRTCPRARSRAVAPALTA